MREEIKQLMQDAAHKAIDGREAFSMYEKAMGVQYPAGLNKYIDERVYELKVKIRNESFLGTAWINGGCDLDIYDAKTLTEIIDLTVNRFDFWRKQKDRDIKKGYIESYSNERILQTYIKDNIEDFFLTYEQIIALEGLKEDPFLSKGELSNFSIALRHWYLEENSIEPYITGQAIVEKYGKKKVEVALNDIRKGRKKGNKTQLLEIFPTLSDYPEIQKQIQKNIDLL